MTAPLIVRAGLALYGTRWQSDMARDLGVADRTVRRWVAGESEPGAGVWSDLLALAEARGKTIDEIAPSLREAAG